MSEQQVDLIMQINDYRAKILRGENISREELADAIMKLRTHRAKTGGAQAEGKAKKGSVPIDLNALFPAKPKVPETPE